MTGPLSVEFLKTRRPIYVTLTEEVFGAVWWVVRDTVFVAVDNAVDDAVDGAVDGAAYEAVFHDVYGAVVP